MRLFTLLCCLFLALPLRAETSFSIPQHISLDRSLVLQTSLQATALESDDDEEEDATENDGWFVAEETAPKKKKLVYRPEKLASPLIYTAFATAAGVGVASIFLFADKKCDDGNEFGGFACNTAVFPVLQFLGTAAFVPAALAPGVAYYKAGHKKRFFATAALRGISTALILVGANGRANDVNDETANAQIRFGVFSYLSLAAFDIAMSGFLPNYKRVER